eukprot:TRINITY_DN36404_c0_g1_i1.p1 TRINITY_DN36404_c0_g1~~TRINITY_DN36404_c0_g1_i1.p1  ORF type:complete len:490 (+),score=161.18 TRINITY_DN36404_c0_g1_i1:66-1535(+)
MAVAQRLVAIVLVAGCWAAGAAKPRQKAPTTLWWHAPFLSGGGYCSEALDFVQGLLQMGRKERGFRLLLGQHGDGFNDDFIDSLPENLTQTLRKLLIIDPRHMPDPSKAVVVCHSETGAWGVREGALYDNLPCPPSAEYFYGEAGGAPPTKPPRYLVGRTMFETDRIPAGWAERCNAADEIWVPTEFHRGSFSAHGVAAEKLHVVPEGVDTAFFDAEKRPTPLRLRHRSLRSDSFIFLSVFKWERRKGWDVLLRAFLEEFPEGGDACLAIKTSTFHSDDDQFHRQVRAFARNELGIDAAEWKRRKPCITVIGDFLPREDLPGLYARGHCLVQPSRGEGWGRPHVEAMSMGLPVIATNWSGVTAYMHPGNALLVPASEAPVPDGPFAGHLWAEPDVVELRRQMRWAYESHRSGDGALAAVGARGRAEVRRRFNLRRMAEVIRWHFRRIQHELRGEEYGDPPPYFENAEADLALLDEQERQAAAAGAGGEL